MGTKSECESEPKRWCLVKKNHSRVRVVSARVYVRPKRFLCKKNHCCNIPKDGHWTTTGRWLVEIDLVNVTEGWLSTLRCWEAAIQPMINPSMSIVTSVIGNFSLQFNQLNLLLTLLSNSHHFGNQSQQIYCQFISISSYVRLVETNSFKNKPCLNVSLSLPLDSSEIIKRNAMKNNRKFLFTLQIIIQHSIQQLDSWLILTADFSLSLNRFYSWFQQYTNWFQR